MTFLLLLLQILIAHIDKPRLVATSQHGSVLTSKNPMASSFHPFRCRLWYSRSPYDTSKVLVASFALQLGRIV